MWFFIFYRARSASSPSSCGIHSLTPEINRQDGPKLLVRLTPSILFHGAAHAHVDLFLLVREHILGKLTVREDMVMETKRRDIIRAFSSSILSAALYPIPTNLFCLAATRSKYYYCV